MMCFWGCEWRKCSNNIDSLFIPYCGGAVCNCVRICIKIHHHHCINPYQKIRVISLGRYLHTYRKRIEKYRFDAQMKVVQVWPTKYSYDGKVHLNMILTQIVCLFETMSYNKIEINFWPMCSMNAKVSTPKVISIFRWVSHLVHM